MKRIPMVSVVVAAAFAMLVTAGEKLGVISDLDEGVCILREEGTLVANDKGIVKIPVEQTLSRECLAGYSLRGSVGTVTLEWTGLAKLRKVHLVFEEPGPCVYAINKVSAIIEIPGIFAMPATVYGWLNREASNVNCPNLKALKFVPGVYIGTTLGELKIVETELRG
jgi:hypothetical protein